MLTAMFEREKKNIVNSMHEANAKLVLLALLAVTCVPASGTISSCGTMSGGASVAAKPWGLEARKPLQLRGGAEWGGQSCDDATPCIGTLQNFSALEDFYAAGDSNAVFREKLSSLKLLYPVGYRPVKGDGNCFIRGYVFGLLESLLSKQATEASGFRGEYAHCNSHSRLRCCTRLCVEYMLTRHSQHVHFVGRHRRAHGVLLHNS
jgi:hypothetical protein